MTAAYSTAIPSHSNYSTVLQCASSSYNVIQHLSSVQREALTCVVAALIVLGLVSNSAAIYAILTLKLHMKNLSTKLILFLFFLDLGVCLIAMPLHMATLITDHTCVTILAAEFCAQTFGHLSAYTTGIIGLDRYLRMRYLNEYSRIVKPWKIFSMVSISFVLSVIHGAAYAAGVVFNWYSTASTIGSVVDGVVFVFMIVPYVLLVYIMKTHRRGSFHQHVLQQVDETINKIAFRIVILVVCLYTPYVIMTMARHCITMDKTTKQYQIFSVTLLMCYHLLYANSFANSLAFISINSACKEKLESLFNRSVESRVAKADIKLKAVQGCRC